MTTLPWPLINRWCLDISNRDMATWSRSKSTINRAATTGQFLPALRCGGQVWPMPPIVPIVLWHSTPTRYICFDLKALWMWKRLSYACPSILGRRVITKRTLVDGTTSAYGKDSKQCPWVHFSEFSNGRPITSESSVGKWRRKSTTKDITCTIICKWKGFVSRALCRYFFKQSLKSIVLRANSRTQADFLTDISSPRAGRKDEAAGQRDQSSLSKICDLRLSLKISRRYTLT